MWACLREGERTVGFTHLFNPPVVLESRKEGRKKEGRKKEGKEGGRKGGRKKERRHHYSMIKLTKC